MRALIGSTQVLAGAALAVLAVAPLASAGVAAAGPGPAPTTVGAGSEREITAEGMKISLAIEPLAGHDDGAPLREGEPARVQLRFTDATTGSPLVGLQPGGWMDRLPPGADDGVEACKRKVQGFLGGSLLSQPEVDLNVFYVLGLNGDGSITVVDPLFSYGGSQLLAIVELGAPGEDWVASRDGGRIFVAVPRLGRVSVIETATWKVSHEIAVGGLPSRLALQPDGRYLWVGDSSDSPAAGVAVIDTETLAVAGRVPTGEGYHDLAFDAADRYAFVSNFRSGTLSVIEIAGLQKMVDLPVAPGPSSIDASAFAGVVYVASTSGAVTVVDANRPRVLTVIPAEPGLGQLRFAPGGRLALAVNPEKDVVHVLDAAQHRIVQTFDSEKGPDQVTFSSELAYLRHRDDATVLMVPLLGLGQEGAAVPVVDFPGGQRAFAAAAAPTPAPSIVQAVGENAMLVANPGDEMIYFYKEGMAAPMGSFRNYNRAARAVMVVDRSLRETSPGLYETDIQLRRAGEYDLAFFLDTPRLVHCFRFAVAVDAAQEAQRQAAVAGRVEYLGAPQVVKAGEPLTLRFRLHGGASSAPAASAVRTLAFLVPGVWQQRQAARSEGEGTYAIDLTPPRPGLYQVQVEARSLGITYRNAAGWSFQATADGPAAGLTAETSAAETSAADPHPNPSAPPAQGAQP